MKKLNKVLALVLAMVMALSLAACSGGGTGETDSLTPEERTQRFVTAITDARSGGRYTAYIWNREKE